MKEHITITGAREHNLQNLTVKLPREKIVVITGLSGSGKSTLAFDTLYAEGQRRYVESLSAYARQFLGLMNKPDVDSIEGLSPAISIEQKTTSNNPRSTVGTVTEIYDYLRLLFARVGTPHCPIHKEKIESQTPQQIAQQLQKTYNKKQITLLAPIIRQKKGTYEQLVKDIGQEGFSRVRIDKHIQKVSEPISLSRYKKHDIDIVIDRLTVGEDKSRLVEAVEKALDKADGLLTILTKNEDEKLISARYACPVCNMSFEELQPRMFSFNSPFGACQECSGLGVKMEFDPELIIPDPSQSIIDGALKIYGRKQRGWRRQQLSAVAKKFGFDLFTPLNDLTAKQKKVLLYGTHKPITGTWSNGAKLYMAQGWEGIIPQANRLYKETQSDYRRRDLERFMRKTPCSRCKGNRLNEKVLSVTIANKNIIQVTDLPIKKALQWCKQLRFPKKDKQIADPILKEIHQRLTFLEKVGLSYLTLSRNAGSLSGGEAQRIRLATQIGANLMGVMYILDEPSIGLHQRDNQKLIDTMHHLRDLGNTLIVVEHDEDTINKADYVVDIGPGAGIHGGKIVATGTPQEITKNTSSLTGDYLARRKTIKVPLQRREAKNHISITGAQEHNLKNINVDIPTGVLTTVTGVSGSGKSTLIQEILYKGLRQQLHQAKERPGKHISIQNEEVIDKVIVIDQSPIGKTPRSNPATYTKIFDDIRKLFSQTKEAKMRGYTPGRFSFNVKEGRCQACQGDGLIKIEMNFLPDIYVECEECHGKRYNQETLEVTYKGKNIAQVLDMSIEEAYYFFEQIPSLQRKLQTLRNVGLDYVKLGQSSTTLSGGEAQRIKLTRELAKRSTGKTLYLLDEPTTGLHFHDVKKLLGVLNTLVNNGNSVLVIEHNLDVIKSSDWIIDLGPEGGEEGGRVVAQGTPENVTMFKESHTGSFLKKLLQK